MGKTKKAVKKKPIVKVDEANKEVVHVVVVECEDNPYDPPLEDLK